MKNKETIEAPPKPKTKPVIVIQDKRNQAQVAPMANSQAQQTHSRSAFGLNLIRGNQQGTPEQEPRKPVPEISPVGLQVEQQLNPSEFEFALMNTLLLMRGEVSRLASILESLNGRIERLEEQRSGEPSAPRKKVRRRAQEIVKSFSCPHESCQKAYGSEVSLNLHIRIKHNSQSLNTKLSVGSASHSNQQRNRGPAEHSSEEHSQSGQESNPYGGDSK